MGNGTSPSGIDLNPLGPIDDGTLARIGSPEPGPIGLDSKSCDSTNTQPNLAQKITAFATQRLATHHGDGQCFTLADDALKNAGAKSAADYGKLTPDADYVWGTSVKASAVKPGDVIQFRNYRYDRTVETEKSDGSSSAVDDFQERPHHTAIVEQVNSDGSMTVLEQNAPDGEPVARNTLFFTGGKTKQGNTTTTIKVKGTVRFYRPQAR